jgi:cytochrome c556
MLKQLAFVIALAGLSSCGSAERPRTARDPAKSTELGIFMKTRMNPPFSRISFLLFHDGETDAGIDASMLPSSADDLARTAEMLGKWVDLPGESEQSKQVFYEYATSLRTDALKLVSAIRDSQWDNAAKIFESLHRKCDSCHHFFRYEQPGGSEMPTRGPGRPAAR